MSQANDRRLPVVIEQGSRDERRGRGGASDTAFAAQLLGQAAGRRGRPTIDQAHSAYLGSEWSGSADRRRRRGSHTLVTA